VTGRTRSHGNLVAPRPTAGLWITAWSARVIHGQLVAAPTVTWSRPRRKTADHATVSWSPKPIVRIPLSYLPVVDDRQSVDKARSLMLQASRTKTSTMQKGISLAQQEGREIPLHFRCHSGPFGKPHRTGSVLFATSPPEDRLSSLGASNGVSLTSSLDPLPEPSVQK